MSNQTESKQDCCGDQSGTPAAAEQFCPINSALTLLNGRWTPHIVYEMLHGRTRFNDIARAIGVNPRTLRERLRELEQEGMVARRVVGIMPPNVEYTLTCKGRALEAVFEALGIWGVAWLEPPAAE